MNILSDRINKLEESETLAMSRKSRELKALGHDVINLSLGEPDFFTPEHIKMAAKDALDKNFTFYPPVSGYVDLREAICRKLKRDNGLTYSPDQIVVSTGAKQSIANCVLTLLNPGDEAIIPSPYWVSYKEIIKLAEAKGVFVQASIINDFKITPEQLEAAITPKSKVFLFSSPCNPTGSVYSREELKALADVLARYPDIIIISDEIYEHINFIGSHESIAQFDNVRDKVVIINGVSKGFAMTGWRLGYMAAPRVIAQACDKLQGQITSGTSTISQRAAITAMDTNPETSSDLKSMLDAFHSRRDQMLEWLKEVPGIKTNVPDGAFYIFADVKDYYGKSNGTVTINSGTDLCDYLLDSVYVALVPGVAFGDPDCIRISYATSLDKLKEAVRRIKVALSKLK
ncbi:MAG TPA: pyridoxal phosphate-dependent aminotransferase [Bacteroidales bacterium]